ncbi:MAG: succinylglutamate desuccinylase/aspartoacylase family protein [Microthrixaceae bacterium]
MSPRERRAPFEMAGVSVPAGRRTTLELPVGRLVSGGQMALPVLVLHGRREGPTMWLSAAIHGDELCGVEIIRRVIASIDPRMLAGTLIAVPVLNVYGFNTGERALPDRRDLNRSFPGSPRGSMAGRIAHLMMTEVVSRCDVGIDLHTGSDNRANLPQIRGDLDDPRTLELAKRFAPPLCLNAKTRDGSLRAAATGAGATVLLMEAGEANRFDETAIGVGTDGVLRVMAGESMIDTAPEARHEPRLSWGSQWVRAARSGIAQIEVDLGEIVDRGQLLASVYDTFGKRLGTLRARTGGMVIGLTRRPLLNRGDAVAHIAELQPLGGAG